MIEIVLENWDRLKYGRSEMVRILVNKRWTKKDSFRAAEEEWPADLLEPGMYLVVCTKESDDPDERKFKVHMIMEVWH